MFKDIKMKYDLDTKYRIKASGTSDEIRLLIKELSNGLDKGSSYRQLKDELKNLEKLVEFQQYTFGPSHRIYYKKDEFLYVPNVSFKEAQKFHYSIFKQFFIEAVKKIEEKNTFNNNNNNNN